MDFVFWILTPCSVAGGKQRFEGTLWLQFLVGDIYIFSQGLLKYKGAGVA
jgi:hypothetical protein